MFRDCQTCKKEGPLYSIFFFKLLQGVDLLACLAFLLTSRGVSGNQAILVLETPYLSTQPDFLVEVRTEWVPVRGLEGNSSSPVVAPLATTVHLGDLLLPFCLLGTNPSWGSCLEIPGSKRTLSKCLSECWALIVSSRNDFCWEILVSVPAFSFQEL